MAGSKPKYFRPPYGAYNKDVLSVVGEYGMEVVNWTNGSLDWEYSDPEKVTGEVMKQLHRGAVILMHDTKAHTAEALPNIIRKIRAEGYEFVVLK